MRILFVCLGNICRSPLADGIMQHIVTQNNLQWEIDSAGTGGWHAGEPPDPRAIKIARSHGLDISSLRARKFKHSDFEHFDRIYAMDENNLKDILSLAEDESAKEKVELFFEAGLGKRECVRDPWYDDQLFSPVYDEILAGCEGIMEKLRRSKQ